MNKRDRLLEKLIVRRGDDVLRLERVAAGLPLSQLATSGFIRDEARRAAADVASLVALRSPETVARLEAERGLT